MEAEQRRAAKEQMIALMQTGHRWQEAVAKAGLQVSRSTAYRLLRQVRSRGEAAFEDGRHGHPAKLRTDERAWLEAYCHTSPGTPSRVVQTAFQERFGIQISLGYLNQVRANLGLGSRTHEVEKKTRFVPAKSNPSGKRVPGDCSWLRQPRRLVCSPRWKSPRLRVHPVAIRAWRIFQRGLVTCWCERCSFSGQSDWIAHGICAATQVMGWACSRADLGPMDISTPNASSHRSLKRTERTPSRMGSHSGQRACGTHRPLQHKRWSLSTTSMGTASLSTLTR